jgi:HK97 family phage prohead protease
MSNNKEVRFIQARELRVAKADDGSRSITGYAAVFNVRSVDFGGWSEMIAPTAFTRTLQDQPDVLALYNHSSGKVLGRTKSGTLKLEIDNVGLKFTCQLPDTTVANDMVVSIERGDIEGCSFGFVTESDVWTSDDNGMAIRTLLDVTLYEVTITAEPAYPATSVSLRSAPKEIRSRILTEKRDGGGDEEDSAPTCDCDCNECKAGNCDGCTDADCVDEVCSCGEKRSQRSIRHKMEMRLKLLQLKK